MEMLNVQSITSDGESVGTSKGFFKIREIISPTAFGTDSGIKYAPNLSSYYPVPDYVLNYKLDGTDATISHIGGDDFIEAPACPDRIGSKFNGTTQYIDADNDAEKLRVGTGAITLSFWYRTTTTGVFVNVLSTNGTTPNDVFGLVVSNGNDLISFRYAAQNGYLHSTAVNDGDWHHVCFTLSGSGGNMLIYIDGNLDATHTSIASYDFNTAITDFKFGINTSGTIQLTGSLDDFRFYDRVLSQSEVTTLYNYRCYEVPNEVTYLDENVTYLGEQVTYTI